MLTLRPWHPGGRNIHSSDVSGSQGGALSTATRSTATHYLPCPGDSGTGPGMGPVPGTKTQLFLSPQSQVLKQHVGERNFALFYQVSQSWQVGTCKEVLLAPPTVCSPPPTPVFPHPSWAGNSLDMEVCGTSSGLGVGSPWTWAGQCLHCV